MAFDQFRGRILSPTTVSKEAEVSVCQVHRWIRAGHIKALTLGHRMTRIDGDSLADFLESRLLGSARLPRCRAGAKSAQYSSMCEA